MTGEFKKGDLVWIDEKALQDLLAKAKTFADRTQVKTRHYEVTGVGPTCLGVRARAGEKSFNVKKAHAIKV